jgi:hypothetical protein
MLECRGFTGKRTTFSKHKTFRTHSPPAGSNRSQPTGQKKSGTLDKWPNRPDQIVRPIYFYSFLLLAQPTRLFHWRFFYSARPRTQNGIRTHTALVSWTWLILRWCPPWPKMKTAAHLRFLLCSSGSGKTWRREAIGRERTGVEGNRHPFWEDERCID